MVEELPIVILGATGGIGSCLARLLSRRGHKLFLVGRNQALLSQLGEETESKISLLIGPLGPAVEEAVLKAHKTLGVLGGIANCIGSLALKPAHRTSYEEFKDNLETNLVSAFATVRGAALTMRKSGGSVVLVSSVAAKFGLPNHEAIAAAKAGVEGLTLSAAASYARYQLRFNAVAPGLT